MGFSIAYMWIICRIYADKNRNFTNKKPGIYFTKLMFLIYTELYFLFVQWD